MWSIECEKEFLRSYDYKKIFYFINNKYYAYIPKGLSSNGIVLNSRNSLIGNWTEKWVCNFLQNIAKKNNLYAVQGVICEELGLTKSSPADLVFSNSQQNIQKPENIKIIFEIKMSIINNYSYNLGLIDFLGDYSTHKGNPSLLRSDSMLKAIGKSANIRTNILSSKIPIVIIGNSPISNYYIEKVDSLKKMGIIQGFCSIYPDPKENCIKLSPNKGFVTFSNKEEISCFIDKLLNSKEEYLSAWVNEEKLSNYIKQAVKYSQSGKKFLELLRGEDNV